MKFSKKSAAVVVSVACSAALALSLAGCGGSDSQVQGSGGDNTVAEQSGVDEKNVDGVDVVDAELTHGEDGRHVFIPVVYWTNTGDVAAAFGDKYIISVYADGVEAQAVEFEGNNFTEKIEPGADQEVKMAFVCDFEEAVDVVVHNIATGEEVTSLTFTVDNSGHEHE